ncbi:MAG: cytochrome c-type biogenesis protein [Candidatus Methanoperedens nitroreducens]|uniref:Cytochrome c-type biogenesis protein n=1 Tax=Candidatus Methanoperedens nitratireducens TaxID=1392998 RepID=A0A0P8AJJ0_9EURY|nr:cytochrome c biogenesis CcdA family protein [Candidatus Methanoperedens sp. BLZ2]KAB2942140.1 MAG: cytochrome c biogenesis protein CcdA [Candidatus Methanoperedens sp.]KPQ44862.1 MAG: cytochrome c-type biogenesis protein [Candidatus Methanoperedens sp. BLZ1]MBZ0177179.1 cytochrome c biogenesis CcdA family protein [Candidatus Methanoperedens nitroreducens]CAG1006699.1 Protein DipZ [Methanosarcinales archaeon]MCX9078851.1 cytochrome c biogenesis CcdA family protein [Candidatus Methanoperedens
MQPSELSVFIVFLAGVVTIMKPCCLPLVPVIFSGSGGHRLRPLAIVSGLTVSFTTMGVLVSAFGATFGAYTDYLRNIAILFIISMGLVLFDQDVNVEFMKISGSVTQGLRGIGLFNKFSSKMPEGSLMGGFFLGMSLGVLWIPCVGPILGAVLALVASVGNMTYGASMLFVYSIGMSLPMLSIAYYGKKVTNRYRWFSRNGELLKKLSGLVLIVIGIMLLFGIDKLMIKLLSPYFPTTFYGI